MRNADKIKPKRMIAIDSHQVAYAVLFGLLLAGFVFAAGFVLGQRHVPKGSQPLAGVSACLALIDEADSSDYAATGDGSIEFDYDERVTSADTATPQTNPVVRLLQNAPLDQAVDEEERGGARPTRDDPAGARTAPRHALDSVPSAPPGPGRFSIQVNAFRQREQAHAFAARFIEMDYPAYVVPVRLPDQNELHRVRIGSFQQRTQAEDFRRSFESHHGLSTIIVTVD